MDNIQNPSEQMNNFTSTTLHHSRICTTDTNTRPAKRPSTDVRSSSPPSRRSRTTKQFDEPLPSTSSCPQSQSPDILDKHIQQTQSSSNTRPGNGTPTSNSAKDNIPRTNRRDGYTDKPTVPSAILLPRNQRQELLTNKPLPPLKTLTFIPLLEHLRTTTTTPPPT
jgi:hypothetical protein